jgi:fructose-1-phosphate kinase PfkB-like protein
VHKGDIVVFSGSVPTGLSGDTYRRLILLAKNIGADTVLDADGAFLREGVEAAPTAVKPNLPEFLRLFDLTSDSRDKIESGVSALLSKDIKRILVSLGPEGARLISEGGMLFAPAMNVPVVSTVGAGDAMTAALALSIEKGWGDEDCLRQACAYAAATVMSEHFERVENETVSELLPQVSISRLI